MTFARLAGVAIVDLRGSGVDDDELVATVPPNAPPLDRAARRVLADWAALVGYRRLWLADRVLDLDPPPPVGAVDGAVPDVHVGVGGLAPGFWAVVRENHHFPGFCPACGGSLPEWRPARRRVAPDPRPRGVGAGGRRRSVREATEGKGHGRRASSGSAASPVLDLPGGFMSRLFRRRRLAPAALVAVLALTGTASAAVVGLPADGTQVNDDPAVGIDPHQDAGASDVVGGSLVPGAPNVPWAAFEQKTGASQQIFVRAFKGGALGHPGPVAQHRGRPGGRGAVDRLRRHRPQGPVDRVVRAELEPRRRQDEHLRQPLQRGREHLGPRGPGPRARPQCPLAEHPHRPHRGEPRARRRRGRRGQRPRAVGRLAGEGRRRDRRRRQEPDLRLARIKQTDCSANAPGGGTSVSTFCWQQTGVKRLNPGAPASSATGDPTLNIDPTRDGIEPDFAFTGKTDTVPWVVWYEQNASGIGLRGNEQVFAAKAVAGDGDGGFHYVAVGRGTAGQTNALDTSGAVHGFGPCAESQAQEDRCSLNAAPGHDAEDPRVAAGTLTPGGTTVPWVTWTEDNGSGIHADLRRAPRRRRPLRAGERRPAGLEHPQRLGAARHHVLRPHAVRVVAGDGRRRGADVRRPPRGRPASSLDTPGGIGGAEPDLRAPVSSNCIATPFDADGDACQGGVAPQAFFLHLQAGAPKRLLGEAIAPAARAAAPRRTRRGPGHGGPGAGTSAARAWRSPATTLRMDRSGNVRLALRCPAGAQTRCRGTVTLAARIAGRARTVGAARFAARPASKASVRVHLAAQAPGPRPAPPPPRGRRDRAGEGRRRPDRRVEPGADGQARPPVARGPGRDDAPRRRCAAGRRVARGGGLGATPPSTRARSAGPVPSRASRARAGSMTTAITIAARTSPAPTR